jgi:hypothetical protein
MLQTNLIGRKAESRSSGVRFEIVGAAWVESAGGLVLIGEDKDGRLVRCNYNAINMLDNDE